MKSIKTFYISDINPETMVFHSQVLGMVKAWNQVARTTLLYHSRKRCDFSSEDFTALESMGWPSIIRLLWRLEALKNNWRKLLAGYDIIHCRDAVTAWMAIKSIPRKKRRNHKIIFDCRGAAVEELAYLPRSLVYSLVKVIRGLEYRSMERLVMNQADVVLAVSERLSRYLFCRYGRGADLIIHSVVDSGRFRFSMADRQKIRRRLGLENEKLFLYVGSPAGWQRLDILGQWWRLYSRNNPADRLLALTNSAAEFLKAAGMSEDANRYHITIDSVSHSEIPAYMSAADYGLIFRDETLVNQVSSPVKLSEYLAAGLLVVTNQEYFTEIGHHGVLVIDPTGDGNLPARYDENERALRSEFWSGQLSNKKAVTRIMAHLFPEA